MKKIDFETHFMTKECLKALYDNKEYPRYVDDNQIKTRLIWYTPDAAEPVGDQILNSLLDLGEGRLKDMDAAGIDVQVLSLTTPGVEHFDAAIGTVLAKKANDLLSEAIQKHPDRFVGFAALAPKDPRAAADELERAVKDLGFKGWKTHANYGETYLDDKKYWPILEKAEKLNVPIFLHPCVPASPQARAYGIALAGAPFGYGFETALCMMRLIYSGVFDKHPGLKVILGHLGEALPFLVTRIDFAYRRPWFHPDARPKIAKKPSDYIKENTYMSISGDHGCRLLLHLPEPLHAARDVFLCEPVIDLVGLEHGHEIGDEGVELFERSPHRHMPERPVGVEADPKEIPKEYPLHRLPLVVKA